MAQTGVSRPVVDDKESFLDALFVLEREDPDTRQHPPQVEWTNRHEKSMRRTGLRPSRGHARSAPQRLPIVQLEADTGSIVDLLTISGACCTFP